MDELEKTHLLTMSGADFGAIAKEKEGKYMAIIGWDDFQKIVFKYYQLGKESTNP